ncbi:hypothetical protein [Mesobacillus thioparans]|uniref:hypothetical protein n=1 Tax=Mesobacillus thioparans TaxID=370439 RepID=UPI0039F13742
MRSEKSGNSGCFLSLVIIVGLIIGVQNIIDYFSDDKEKSETVSTYESKPHAVVEGQNGYLVGPIFIAADKDSYDEMWGYIVEENNDALARMMENGRLFAGAKGGRVTVVDFGLTTSLIEVIDTGLRGYVPTEKVKSRLE